MWHVTETVKFRWTHKSRLRGHGTGTGTGTGSRDVQASMPTGQPLEAIAVTALPAGVPRSIKVLRTQTDPQFYFAFDELDDDMTRMARHLIVEPTLTRTWHELTSECCRRHGTVIDVGANYGWYALYSLALGCHVSIFEPVPAFIEILRIGLLLNNGFAERATIYRNVVSSSPGEYTLPVPIPRPIGFPYLKKLGMTGMVGEHGVIKGYDVQRFRHYNVTARSVRIDDELRVSLSATRDVCMLKLDVEGYEPQALASARRLLSERCVLSVQLEMTRREADLARMAAAGGCSHRTQAAQSERNIAMLSDLYEMGYTLRVIGNAIIDSNYSLPAARRWKHLHTWRGLPRLVASGAPAHLPAIRCAYWQVLDFKSISTNLVGLQRRASCAQKLPEHLRRSTKRSSF